MIYYFRQVVLENRQEGLNVWVRHKYVTAWSMTTYTTYYVCICGVTKENGHFGIRLDTQTVCFLSKKIARVLKKVLNKEKSFQTILAFRFYCFAICFCFRAEWQNAAAE